MHEEATTTRHAADPTTKCAKSNIHVCINICMHGRVHITLYLDGGAGGPHLYPKIKIDFNQILDRF